MRILYLSHRYPYPPHKGEKIRAFHQIRHLASRHELRLATLLDPEVPSSERGALEEICAEVAAEGLGRLARASKGSLSLLRGRSITEGWFSSRRLQRVIDGWILDWRPDVILVNSSSMAPYVGGRGKAPRVLDFVDLDSAKWDDFAERCSPSLRALYRWEASRLRRFEGELLEAFQRCIVITDEEAALFRSRFPEARLDVVGNGVDLDYFNFRPAAAGSRDIVFTGRMDYLPNVDGVIHFATRVLPEIERAVPGTRLVVVGACPTPAVRRLHDGRRIVVTGRVADVRPYLHEAAVAVVPLRIGRGLQNKVLEALASGPAVVVTPQAREGIGGTSGEELVVARHDGELAASIGDLLQDEKKRFLMARRGRKLVEARFGWPGLLERLEAILEDVVASR